jgi:biopolymer transport protein ExbB
MIETLIKWSAESYGLLPLMSVLLLATIAVIIERLYFYTKVLKAGDAMEHDVQLVKYQSVADLQAVAQHYEGTMQVDIVKTAIASRGEDATTMDRHIEESIMWLLPKMDRNLWIVDTAVTLAPLLGLLGTIIGMIQSFNVLGSAAKGNPDMVTGGIAHALIATAFGLLIAIIAVVFLNYFNKKNRLALHQMELLKAMVINRLYGGGSTMHGGGREAVKSPARPAAQPAKSGA